MGKKFFQKNKSLILLFVALFIMVVALCFGSLAITDFGAHSSCPASSSATIVCPSTVKTHFGLLSYIGANTFSLVFNLAIFSLFIGRILLRDTLFRTKYNFNEVGAVEQVRHKAQKRLYYWLALNNKPGDSILNGRLSA